MALEDRVKQLEDEIKVLKNEIQTTLLDIQEQILSHYYPSLYPTQNAENPKLNQVDSIPPIFNALPEQPQQQREIEPIPNGYKKYKTQTITLVEEPEDEEDEDDFEPEMPLGFTPSPVKSNSIKKPQNAVNSPVNGQEAAAPKVEKRNRKPELKSPNKTGDFLAEENDLFLDSLLSPAKNEEKEEGNFDEFSQLFETKHINTTIENDPLTGDMLDDLFNETFPFLNENGNTNHSLRSTQKSALNSEAVKLTVRKLMTWVDDSISVIGKDKTKRAIDMYARSGDLSIEMEIALKKLVDISHQTSQGADIGIRQIIDVLGNLNDILDHHTPEYLNEVLAFIVEVNFG